MDMSKLSTGAKVTSGAAVLLLIVSFFNWFQVNDIGYATMWHGIGVLAGILVLAVIAWQVMLLMGIKIALPISSGMAGAFLALLALVFVFLRWINDPAPNLPGIDTGRTIWAWLGLIFAIVMVIGAILEMQAGGESFSDMKGSLMAAGTAASAKARSATDSTHDASDASTTPAPAAPAPPAPTESMSDPGMSGGHDHEAGSSEAADPDPPRV